MLRNGVFQIYSQLRQIVVLGFKVLQPIPPRIQCNGYKHAENDYQDLSSKPGCFASHVRNGKFQCCCPGWELLTSHGLRNCDELMPASRKVTGPGSASQNREPAKGACRVYVSFNNVSLWPVSTDESLFAKQKPDCSPHISIYRSVGFQP